MGFNGSLSILAGVLFLLAFVPYIRAIVRGETKPSKASWIIWGILDTITFVGMYTKNAINGQITGAVIGSWIVVTLTLKHGMPGWKLQDKLCLVGAMLGILLWQIFDNPILGITISLSVVFLGAIPTFISAWEDPRQENKTAWTLYWISCVVAVIAAPSWEIQDAAQPLTFFTIESVMMYILYFPRYPVSATK